VPVSCSSLVVHARADKYTTDTFAAWWMSRYGGYVPKGSLYSFLQRLAMKRRL
jgi:hypothetical protein